MAVQMDMDTELHEFADLTNLLWREREVLNLVLFKLIEEQLVVAAGQTRWLPDANRELESALDELRTTEVLRAVESDALTDRLGLGPDATLAEIAEVAAEPWSAILREHREALLSLAGEVKDATEQNRRLLTAGAKLVRDTLHSITTSAGIYDARGTTAPGVRRLSRLDEQA